MWKLSQLNKDVSQINKVMTMLNKKQANILLFHHNKIDCKRYLNEVYFILGIEDVEVFDKLKMLFLKPLERKCKNKQIWTELTKIWQSDHNLVKGFLLNSAERDYAIAIQVI